MAKQKLLDLFASRENPQLLASAVQVVTDQYAAALGGYPQLEAALRDQGARCTDLADLVHTLTAAEDMPEDMPKKKKMHEDMEKEGGEDKPKEDQPAEKPKG